MSGSGSMLHAVISMKNNLALKRSNRLGKRGYTATKRKYREIFQPDITKEELEKIKVEIRAKGKRQRLIENSIVAILSLIIFSLFYIYIF